MMSQDWPAGHSTQYAPDAVQPGGHSWQVPVVSEVTQRKLVGPPIMSIHCRLQLGIVVTGYEQKSAPHVVEVLQAPPLHTVSASAPHAWYVVHPTPQVEQGVQTPSWFPPHPRLYCPAGHLVQSVQTPFRFWVQGPRYRPVAQPPEVHPTQGGSDVGDPSHGIVWYMAGSHVLQATQVTTSDAPVPLHAPDLYWLVLQRVLQAAQVMFFDALGGLRM